MRAKHHTHALTVAKRQAQAEGRPMSAWVDYQAAPGGLGYPWYVAAPDERPTATATVSITFDATGSHRYPAQD